jgi:predicted phage terminase large subunit-like protein
MAYWTHRLFYMKCDPETREPLPDQLDYAAMKINPEDNVENLPDGYIETLKGMSARMRRRFLHGEYADANPSALFAQEHLDRWRHVVGELPDMQRIVVAVDPSGSGDIDNADNDAIGICVCGLGVDGNGYLLEDLTVKAGPATWGNVATTAYDRHRADLIVAETNFGGAMVESVIRAARPRTPFRAVTASRGKVVRAEPIASLTESGKVRLAGMFPALEDELAGFTTNGYIGSGSPNRADAMVWGFSELFHGIVREQLKPRVSTYQPRTGANAWMGA